MSVKVTIQYSNYSVVSFPHYNSSTVVLTVIAVLVILYYTDSRTKIKLNRYSLGFLITYIIIIIIVN